MIDAGGLDNVPRIGDIICISSNRNVVYSVRFLQVEDGREFYGVYHSGDRRREYRFCLAGRNVFQKILSFPIRFNSDNPSELKYLLCPHVPELGSSLYAAASTDKEVSFQGIPISIEATFYERRGEIGYLTNVIRGRERFTRIYFPFFPEDVPTLLAPDWFLLPKHRKVVERYSY